MRSSTRVAWLVRCRGRLGDALDRESEPVVGAGVLLADRCELLLRGRAERRLRVRLERHRRPGIARDRVSAHSAVEAREPERLRSKLRARTRPSALIAFTRPLAMSPPEWPPLRAGEHDPRARRDPAGAARASSGTRRNVCVAPGAADRQRVVARPVEIDEHAARDERRVERLRAVEALLLGHREEELERPVLDRGVVRDGHRRRDADAVVGAERRSLGAHPVAVDDERRSALPADRTGCSGSRSQTMSRCDWRTTVGAPSRPAEAGTRTTTLPSRPRRASKPRAAAQARTCSRAGSSCFDGRAIRVSSAKRSQTSAGSRPAEPGPLTGEA